jgi:hypothetical protein
MGLTVHQAKDHERAGTGSAYVSPAHTAAETGAQPERLLFRDTAFCGKCCQDCLRTMQFISKTL